MTQESAARPTRVSRWRAGGTRFVLVRAAQGVLTLLIVSMLIFFATQLMPGDVALIVLGESATPEQLAILREHLGLDQPAWLQYLHWLAGVAHLDFGTSLASGATVSSMIGARLTNSLTLAAVALVIMFPLSLVTGITAARMRDRLADKGFLTLSMIANATPEFVMGTVFIALLGTTVWPVLPPVSLIPPGDSPLAHLPELALPVLTLVVGGSAYLSRLIRASFIDVMSSEYIQMARLKGLSERRIVYLHALPNALGPAIPAASLVAAFTIGGVVVVEFMFAFPGIGTLLVEAITARDVPVIQAVVLIIAASYFVLNLVADLLSAGRRNPTR
ncbi:ABC transporter permease [Microbacterium sp.]|uniref:ABC transporter permease n=1 Tax=Microbacterium sp. TaxID=51671 RepID=UPI0039E72203